MTALFSGDDTGDETGQCGNCGRTVSTDELRGDGYCRRCGASSWTQNCPRCGSTAISSETRTNPRGYRTHAPGTITVWECDSCGFRSGYRHDWRWR